jgi:hypothetical protein
MVPKVSTFPSGIKALAHYIHRKGLKLGIYSDAGYQHINLRLMILPIVIVQALFMTNYNFYAETLLVVNVCLDHWDMKYKMPKLLPLGYII